VLSFNPLWIAAAPGALAIVIWTFVDLQRFVLFAVLLAMNLPSALVRPAGTQVALADLLLLAALFAWLVSGAAGVARGPWLKGNRLLGPAVLFVALNAASLLWSSRPRDTVVFTIQLIEIVLIFPLVFASLPRSIDVIRHAMLAFIALTSGMAFVAIEIFLKGAATGALGETGLPFDLNKNVIGSYLAAGLVMAYALGMVERGGRLRRVLQIAALVEIAGVFATLSRGSVIGAIVAVLALSLLLRRNRVLTVGLMVVVAVGYVATNGISSHYDVYISGSYDSGEVRVYAFQGAIKKFQERPLLGTGGGTYRDTLPQLDDGFILPDPNNMFLLTLGELPEPAAVPAVAAGCVTLSLFAHFQVDVTWTRGTTSLAFAMMGLMIAAQRLAHEAVGAQRAGSAQQLPVAEARVPAGVA
jgi:hypothetical protein